MHDQSSRTCFVCFVLEYMNANSLQHLLKRSNQTPMDEAVVSRITQGILAGIGAAALLHALGHLYACALATCASEWLTWDANLCAIVQGIFMTSGLSTGT